MAHSSNIPLSSHLRTIVAGLPSSDSCKDMLIVSLDLSAESPELCLHSEYGSASNDTLRAAACSEDCFFAIARSRELSVIILVAYVGDHAPVKKRMAYASSCVDFKKEVTNMLSSTFRIKYATFNCPEDLSEFDVCSAFTSAEGSAEDFNHRAHAASDHDRLKEQVLKAESEAKNSASAGSGAAVSFKYEGVAEAVQMFSAAAGNGQQAFKIVMDKETVVPDGEYLALTSGSDLSFNPMEPRFYVIRLDSINYFVYSCPDEALVRQKMVYSTVKPSFTDYLTSQCALTIHHRAQISDAADFNPEHHKEAAANPTHSSASKFARPTRPGKGKARLI
eukprot:ANDGO_02537.mRNA.1 Twinfilin